MVGQITGGERLRLIQDSGFRVSIPNPEMQENEDEQMSTRFKKLISANEHDKLIKYEILGSEVALFVPTAEHYLPPLQTPDEPLEIFNEAVDSGSISMTSVKIG